MRTAGSYAPQLDVKVPQSCIHSIHTHRHNSNTDPPHFSQSFDMPDALFSRVIYLFLCCESTDAKPEGTKANLSETTFKRYDGYAHFHKVKKLCALHTSMTSLKYTQVINLWGKKSEKVTLRMLKTHTDFGMLADIHTAQTHTHTYTPHPKNTHTEAIYASAVNTLSNTYQVSKANSPHKKLIKDQYQLLLHTFAAPSREQLLCTDQTACCQEQSLPCSHEYLSIKHTWQWMPSHGKVSFACQALNKWWAHVSWKNGKVS